MCYGVNKAFVSLTRFDRDLVMVCVEQVECFHVLCDMHPHVWRILVKWSLLA